MGEAGIFALCQVVNNTDLLQTKFLLLQQTQILWAGYRQLVMMHKYLHFQLKLSVTDSTLLYFCVSVAATMNRNPSLNNCEWVKSSRKTKIPPFIEQQNTRARVTYRQHVLKALLSW